MRAILASMAMLALGACSSSPTAVACTEEARPGIIVRVVSEPDGSPAASGAVLTLEDGDFHQVVDQTIDGLILYGATERPGTYDVTVARAGFHSWIRSDVEVELTPSGCHVVTVELEASLSPL